MENQVENEKEITWKLGVDTGLACLHMEPLVGH